MLDYFVSVVAKSYIVGLPKLKEKQIMIAALQSSYA
jgi:hypothetical protein